MCYYVRPFATIFIGMWPGSTAVTLIWETNMGGNELIVAFFALAFLAFCLTAVALYALSRDKDDVADKSVDGLRQLHLSSRPQPKPNNTETPQSDEAPD
ncbi:MAG: hypothetical protein R3D55_19200 [Chloroflexota bacterium]